MALKDTVQLIRETQRGLLGTKKGVSEAKDAYHQLAEEIRLAAGRLKYKKSTRHADTFSKKVLKALKVSKEARSILMKEIDDALARGGKEFEENSDIYKKHLYEVADNEDIYLLTVLGAGWGARLSPQIIFEHAGTLNDYARGINEFRISINTKIGQQGTDRGLKATSWWKKNIYGTTKYDRTIEQRIAFSGRDAPFWSLLAHGSVSMPSDRPDGSYNPYPARGVDFILNTEDALIVRFAELFGTEKSIWEEETIAYEREIESANKLLNRLQDDLDDLTTDYQRTQNALRKLGEDAKFASEEKLAKAAKRLRAGEEFEGERVELTAPGFSKIRRVRPTVARLEGLLGY